MKRMWIKSRPLYAYEVGLTTGLRRQDNLIEIKQFIVKENTL
jgi:hypothetical protein